ncbi:hypothetical protein JCM8097_005452 [Rhodosporidiobolus ruineniae]
MAPPPPYANEDLIPRCEWMFDSSLLPPSAHAIGALPAPLNPNLSAAQNLGAKADPTLSSTIDRIGRALAKVGGGMRIEVRQQAPGKMASSPVGDFVAKAYAHVGSIKVERGGVEKNEPVLYVAHGVSHGISTAALRAVTRMKALGLYKDILNAARANRLLDLDAPFWCGIMAELGTPLAINRVDLNLQKDVDASMGDDALEGWSERPLIPQPYDGEMLTALEAVKAKAWSTIVSCRSLRSSLGRDFAATEQAMYARSRWLNGLEGLGGEGLVEALRDEIKPRLADLEEEFAPESMRRINDAEENTDKAWKAVNRRLKKLRERAIEGKGKCAESWEQRRRHDEELKKWREEKKRLEDEAEEEKARGEMVDDVQFPPRPPSPPIPDVWFEEPRKYVDGPPKFDAYKAAIRLLLSWKVDVDPLCDQLQSAVQPSAVYQLGPSQAASHAGPYSASPLDWNLEASGEFRQGFTPLWAGDFSVQDVAVEEGWIGLSFENDERRRQDELEKALDVAEGGSSYATLRERALDVQKHLVMNYERDGWMRDFGHLTDKKRVREMEEAGEAARAARGGKRPRREQEDEFDGGLTSISRRPHQSRLLPPPPPPFEQQYQQPPPAPQQFEQQPYQQPPPPPQSYYGAPSSFAPPLPFGQPQQQYQQPPPAPQQYQQPQQYPPQQQYQQPPPAPQQYQPMGGPGPSTAAHLAQRPQAGYNPMGGGFSLSAANVARHNAASQRGEGQQQQRGGKREQKPSMGDSGFLGR